jgi:hypothetical protein
MFPYNIQIFATQHQISVLHIFLTYITAIKNSSEFRYYCYCNYYHHYCTISLFVVFSHLSVNFYSWFYFLATSSGSCAPPNLFSNFPPVSFKYFPFLNFVTFVQFVILSYAVLIYVLPHTAYKFFSPFFVSERINSVCSAFSSPEVIVTDRHQYDIHLCIDFSSCAIFLACLVMFYLIVPKILYSVQNKKLWS